MTDIISKLREYAALESSELTGNAMREAANEIESVDY